MALIFDAFQLKPPKVVPALVFVGFCWVSSCVLSLNYSAQAKASTWTICIWLPFPSRGIVSAVLSVGFHSSTSIIRLFYVPASFHGGGSG